MVDVTVNPKIRSYLAVGMPVTTPPISDVIFELSLVNLTVFPSKLAPSVLEVVGIGALEGISVI